MEQNRDFLIENFNNFLLQRLMLFARCSPESEKMYQLLLKNGFAYVETSKEGYRGMIYEL